MTLCFVLWRFDFGVLTFYFHILSFLFCVLCTILFILNGAIHEVKTRYRRKDGRKRSYKYFNAFIVHVMLMGFFTFKFHAADNYHKSKIYRSCYKVGSLSVKAFKKIQDNSIRNNLVPYNTLTNLNCNGSLLKDFIL